MSIFDDVKRVRRVPIQTRIEPALKTACLEIMRKYEIKTFSEFNEMALKLAVLEDKKDRQDRFSIANQAKQKAKQ